MGRITVFCRDHCPHSKRAKHALESRGIPYTEISLSLHPHRRNDMFTLCDQYSIPQVFFNTRHVGGADETIELMEEWDDDASKTDSRFCTPLERYEFEIGSRPDPSNPLMDPSTAATTTKTLTEDKAKKIEKIERDDNDIINQPGGSTTCFFDITENLKKILPKNDFDSRYNENCFTGIAAVKAVISHFNNEISEEDAVLFCKQLQEKNVICQIIEEEQQQRSTASTLFQATPLVSFATSTTTTTSAASPSSSTAQQQQRKNQQEKEFQNAEDYWYCLQCHKTPKILNSYRIYEFSEGVVNINTTNIQNKTKISNLIVHLFSLMADIESAVTSRYGRVNYKIAPKCKSFPIFEEAVCQLQKVDVSALDDEHFRIAYAMNVYNLMLKYAFMKLGISTSKVSQTAFLESIQFNIGGKLYSFQDWFHGILRGNRKAPTSKKIQFAKNDSRKKLSLSLKQDDDANTKTIKLCQIHFGTSLFTRSSPPIEYFAMLYSSSSSSLSTDQNKNNTTTLQDELDMLSYAFCEDNKNVNILYKEREVCLVQMFDTYRSDFSSTSSSTTNSAVAMTANISAGINAGISSGITAGITAGLTGCSDQELLAIVLRFLRGTKKIQLERLLESKQKIKVSFQDEEEWTVNAGDFVPFNLGVEAGGKTIISGPMTAWQNSKSKSLNNMRKFDQSKAKSYANLSDYSKSLYNISLKKLGRSERKLSVNQTSKVGGGT